MPLQDLDDVTLLLHHTHPNPSNGYEAQVRGYDARNHQTDYLKIAEHLPEGVNFVATKADHWKTTPDFYQRIKEEVEADYGGTFTEYKRHVTFDIGGGFNSIINGLEASLVKDSAHFTCIGYPIQEEEALHDLTTREFFFASRDFLLVGPAHSYMPGFNIPDTQLENFFRVADDDGDITPIMNYATGYAPAFNRAARGTGLLASRDGDVDEKRDIHDYVQGYNLPLIPELDMHAVVPKGLEGAAVLDGDVMEELKDEDVPLMETIEEYFFSADVLCYGEPGSEGISYFEFLFQNYPDALPGYHKISKKFLPYTEQDFREVRDSNLDTLEEATTDRVLVNRYDPVDYEL